MSRLRCSLGRVCPACCEVRAVAFTLTIGLRSGTPSVSAAWENANINDDPVILSNVFGTMAYADAGPDTRTTQIFVNLGDNSGLDAQGFAPFGTISSTDMGVFSKIYAGYGQDPDQDLIYSQVCILLVDDWVGRVMYWEMSMGPPPTRCRILLCWLWSPGQQVPAGQLPQAHLLLHRYNCGVIAARDMGTVSPNIACFNVHELSLHGAAVHLDLRKDFLDANQGPLQGAVCKATLDDLLCKGVRWGGHGTDTGWQRKVGEPQPRPSASPHQQRALAYLEACVVHEQLGQHLLQDLHGVPGVGEVPRHAARLPEGGSHSKESCSRSLHRHPRTSEQRAPQQREGMEW